MNESIALAYNDTKAGGSSDKVRKGPKPRDERERFLSHVKVGEPHACWLWTAACDKNGYGQFKFRRKMERAHVVAHILFIGPIPAGHEVHHTCDNPPCVNWKRHLAAVTPAEHHGDLSPRSPAFINKRKTHCPAGHPYDEANTRIGKQGPNGTITQRACRACDAAHARDKRAVTARAKRAVSLKMIHTASKGKRP